MFSNGGVGYAASLIWLSRRPNNRVGRPVRLFSLVMAGTFLSYLRDLVHQLRRERRKFDQQRSLSNKLLWFFRGNRYALLGAHLQANVVI